MAAQVRRLLPADADAYVVLRRAMLLDTPPAYLASPEDDRASDPASVRAQLEATATSALFGAYVDGSLVGAVGVARERQRKVAHRACIWGVYVAPEHRRHGLGRSLLHAAIAHARTLPGVVRLDLSVSAATRPALRLYESLGFRAWGTEPRALCVAGVFYDEHHMALPLDGAPDPA